MIIIIMKTKQNIHFMNLEFEEVYIFLEYNSFW